MECRTAIELRGRLAPLGEPVGGRCRTHDASACRGRPSADRVATAVGFGQDAHVRVARITAAPSAGWAQLGGAVRRQLTWRVWVGICVLIAIVPRLLLRPTDLFFDDLVQYGMVVGDWPLRHPWEMYRFFDGSAVENTQLRDIGLVPWFSDPQMRGGALRPISSLSLWLDYSLWGANTSALRLGSLAWFVAALVAAAALLRRVIGKPAASLALLLYALSATHAVPSVWIANRCSWIAATFSFVAIWAYVRWRADDWRPGVWLAPLAFALALFSGEYALSALPFFALYALLIDSGPWRGRVVSLLPIGAIFVAHSALFVLLGYGGVNGLAYLDPFSAPAAFLAHFWDAYFPLMMLGTTALPLFMLGPITNGLLAVSVLAVLIAFGPRRRELRTVIWLLAATLLSIIPLTTAPAPSRLLVVTSLGFLSVIALCGTAAFERARSGGRAAWVGVALAVALMLTHLVTGPWAGYGEMLAWSERAKRGREAVATVPTDVTGDVIVLADPFARFPRVRLRMLGRDAPRSWHALSTSPGAHRVWRKGERELILTLDENLLDTSMAHVLTSVENMPKGPVRAGAFVAEILQLAPATILRVKFDEPLEHYDLLTLDDDGYHSLEPLPIGGRIELPSLRKP